MMDRDVSGDRLAADDSVPSHRMQDCGATAVTGSSEEKMAAPSPQTPQPSATAPNSSSEGLEMDRVSQTAATVPETAPSAEGEGGTMSHNSGAADPPAEDTEEDRASQTEATVPETAPSAEGEGGAADSPAEDTVSPGSMNTSESVSVPLAVAKPVTTGKVRRRKSSPKKREMPANLKFPLDMKDERSSDEEHSAAINTEASSEEDRGSQTEATVPETAPSGEGEGGTMSHNSAAADSPAEDPVSPGSFNTSESVSVPLTMEKPMTSGKVRRRKSSPKKREMPDDLKFPLDIKEEGSSDEEYSEAVNTEASSDAACSLSSAIQIAQNGTNTPQQGSQKSKKARKKKRTPAFKKPLLVKNTSDTASLMFVMPNEEMDSIVDAKKRRKRKEEEYEELHWCDVCDECFSEEAALAEHVQTHLDQPKEDFDCEDCGRVFDSASELEQHRSAKHGKLRYFCDICGIQYNYESQYVIHMRAHSGERPYVCGDCGRSFGHKCSLVVHERIHTGITPHQCKKCMKMVDTRGTLAKHARMRYCPDCKTCYTHRSFAKHLIKNCVKA